MLAKDRSTDPGCESAPGTNTRAKALCQGCGNISSQLKRSFGSKMRQDEQEPRLDDPQKEPERDEPREVLDALRGNRDAAPNEHRRGEEQGRPRSRQDEVAWNLVQEVALLRELVQLHGRGHVGRRKAEGGGYARRRKSKEPGSSRSTSV